MPPVVRVAAVDLGATSGRVVLGDVAVDRLELTEVHRFHNGAVRTGDGSLHWDLDRIFGEVLTGLAAAGPVDAVGIDTWGVDYGLVDPDGQLLGAPFSYRDERSGPAVPRVRSLIGEAEHYAITGVQHLPFNTVFQLAADGRVTDGVSMLLLPDLLTFWLTGVPGAEVTNASTTALLDARTRTWSSELIRRLGLPEGLLPSLHEPGTVVGPLLPGVAERTGQRTGTPVVAVASHDTASAVVGVPVQGDVSGAYVSAGTWSLVGLELPEPVLTDRSRAAGFTNEVGLDGTVRFLRNVAGLWVLSQAMEAWGETDVAALVEAAAASPPGGPVVDVDAPEFLAPGDMERRVRDACAATGQRPPQGRAAVVRCLLDSLALAHRRAIRDAAAASDREVEVVHLVGGGARNALLCRLTADACGLPVVAGPVEATAIGNVLVQARALGVRLPNLAAMRSLVLRTQTTTRYEPRGGTRGWDQAEARLRPPGPPSAGPTQGPRRPEWS